MALMIETVGCRHLNGVGAVAVWVFLFAWDFFFMVVGFRPLPLDTRWRVRDPLPVPTGLEIWTVTKIGHFTRIHHLMRRTTWG